MSDGPLGVWEKTGYPYPFARRLPFTIWLLHGFVVLTDRQARTLPVAVAARQIITGLTAGAVKG